jgi:hypothetical protein
MRNRARMAGAAVVLLGLLVGCVPAAAEPDLPSLAESAASSSAVAPPAGPPGPAVSAACPLLSEAEVEQALGHPVAFAREEPGGSGPDGGAFTCGYGFGDGNAMMIVSITPAAAGSAQQQVDRSVQSYSGELETLTDLGDAAIYNDWPGTKWEYVTTAKASGDEVRTVHLAAFLDGELRPGLIELARLVMDRI